ncbi:MAG TPA: M48 family metalloprotease [Burkholderiales bacterium]
MNRVLVATLLVLGIAYAGPALAVEVPGIAGQADPFLTAADTRNLTPVERRLWDQASEFDDLMRRSGYVLRDDAFGAYMQAIADRLYPDLAGTVRLRLVKSPFLNAFALPNGSVYVNQGLAARFENEAQLATVLAHEIAHFALRHGYRSQETAKNSSLLRTLLALIRVPIPGNLVDIIYASSVFGYSRGLETEADDYGYKKVVAAGYASEETPKVFEHLMREVKTADIREPFFFSTHPKLEDRVNNYKALSRESPPGGEVLEQVYEARVMGLRIANLENELSMGRARHVLLALCNERELEDYPPQVHYYLGEAYRQRGGQLDEVSAEQEYLEAIRRAPDFAPSYRALGALYYKDRAWAEAAHYLSEYLARAPMAPDRGYVEGYLRSAREKSPNP